MADANLKINTALLDGLIVGRVEPHIYAFSTETVPNYLKVGDTARGVRVRLDEWRKIFPNLIQQYVHSAQINNETIFRDFAVHTFLEQEKGRRRLLPDTFGHLPYYSKEFFEGATTADLEEAISDIYQSAREKNGKYQFYSPDRLPQTLTYERTDSYPPRANQQQVIENFRNAIVAGRTNLLLYAVMRFGKSFTAMCCAKEMDAKIVVVVSAKADVKQEWKKTVESHVYFAGYKFLDSASLNSNETIVADTLAAGDKVALFLTLQDLQGEGIKAKHKEVFEHQIDLLIVDETHFGARGASYGKVLQQYNLSKSQIEKELQNIELNERALVTENDLEQSILDNLQHFLLEMGHGFCFEARQKRILIDEDYFFADLVFYHRILKCHVIVELKIDKFCHEYASQLNMYLNYFKAEIMQPDDNPPIGILLCTEKGDTLVKYATAGLDPNIFVQKYMIELPSEEEIKRFILGVNF